MYSAFTLINTDEKIPSMWFDLLEYLIIYIWVFQVNDLLSFICVIQIYQITVFLLTLLWYFLSTYLISNFCFVLPFSLRSLSSSDMATSSGSGGPHTAAAAQFTLDKTLKISEVSKDSIVLYF